MKNVLWIGVVALLGGAAMWLWGYYFTEHPSAENGADIGAAGARLCGPYVSAGGFILALVGYLARRKA